MLGVHIIRVDGYFLKKGKVFVKRGDGAIKLHSRELQFFFWVK